MLWNTHSRLESLHAFLSASKHSWVNYDDEKLGEAFRTAQAAAMGTRLHALAAEHIRLKLRMPRNKATFNAYVNDAIGYGLDPEVVLYHSENAFGTADAIGFDEKKRLLRIHDLKTGVTRVNMVQLHIYAALFCLEYEKLPGEIDFETRIYQNDDILVDKPQPDDIAHIMDKITWFDKLIEEIKSEDA